MSAEASARTLLKIKICNYFIENFRNFFLEICENFDPFWRKFRKSLGYKVNFFGGQNFPRPPFTENVHRVPS